MFQPVSTSMRTKFMNEVRAAGLHLAASSAAPALSSAEFAALPEAVQRYLRYMGVVGRPRDVSLRAHFTGRFRLKPGPFMSCEAWQYNTRADVARFFHVRMHFGGVLPVLARDTYRDGRGRMLGKLADLVTIVDGTGPELDTGELVTYLNDAILMAPSLVLGPETTWTSVDANSFDVAFTDKRRTVRARVSVDSQGAPIEFSTHDRFYQADFRSPLVQTRWSTPVDELQLIDGRHVVTRARAVWHLPDGPFVYADFKLDPAALAFNILPGA